MFGNANFIEGAKAPVFVHYKSKWKNEEYMHFFPFASFLVFFLLIFFNVDL